MTKVLRIEQHLTVAELRQRLIEMNAGDAAIIQVEEKLLFSITLCHEEAPDMLTI